MRFDYQQTRKDIIGNCLKAMYIRYRKNLPDFFDKEVDYAVNDFKGIPDDEIAQAFAKAYSDSDEKMPITKTIARVWLENRRPKSNKIESCGVCSNGAVSVRVCDEDHYVTTRCQCVLGDQMPSNILRHEPYMKLTRIKKQ